VLIIASREDAGQVLLEAHAGFFRNAGRVGIYSLQKIPDFLLNLTLDDPDLRTAWWGNLPWLDLVLHFRLHSLPIPRQTYFDLFTKATRSSLKTPGGRISFGLGRNNQTYRG
jgi:hypothetical protein